MKGCMCAVAAALLAANIGVTNADEVTDWNNVMLDLIRQTSTNPPRATRVFAMVQTAVYDAVNGIEGGYEPYFVTKAPSPGASSRAAAVSAAYTVLNSLFPAHRRQLKEMHRASMAAIPGSASQKAKGTAYGEFCANKILGLRHKDGSDDVVPYQPSGVFGFWQPTPPGFAPALLPNWPYVKPFAMTSGDQFRAPPPPPFDSADYATAYNEVKDYGGVVSALRTADQTEIAYFWEDGVGTVTPPGHWQLIAQQLSADFGLTMPENARLFALLSIIQADAAISAWDSKYFWDYVRPYTAITLEADLDGNSDTAADPTWFNLIPTPPFPSYTSGHSTFSGSSSRLLEHFLGTDDIAFCGESPDPDHWPAVLPGVVRCWDSLSQAAEEAGQSRIYGGIHWQYDNSEGLAAGRALADYVFANFLLPD